MGIARLETRASAGRRGAAWPEWRGKIHPDAHSGDRYAANRRARALEWHRYREVTGRFAKRAGIPAAGLWSLSAPHRHGISGIPRGRKRAGRLERAKAN